MRKEKSTRICKECDRKLPNDAKFCPHCGGGIDVIKKVCLKCSTQCDASDRFCYKCGHSLDIISVKIDPDEYGEIDNEKK